MDFENYAEQQDNVAIFESLQYGRCINLIAGTKIFIINPTPVFIGNPLHPGHGASLITIRQAGSIQVLYSGLDSSDVQKDASK